eukprot:3467900-Rhodomonas_salina.1
MSCRQGVLEVNVGAELLTQVRDITKTGAAGLDQRVKEVRAGLGGKVQSATNLLKMDHRQIAEKYLKNFTEVAGGQLGGMLEKVKGTEGWISDEEEGEGDGPSGSEPRFGGDMILGLEGVGGYEPPAVLDWQMAGDG